MPEYIMRQAEQIGVIGTSHIFTAPLAADLCHEPRLTGSEVLLYDINPQRALEAAQVCDRYAKEVGADIRFRAVTDMQTAIIDSSHILQTALAGGREKGDQIKKAVAQKTGIYGPVEAHAPYAQLKLMLDIAKEIQRLNPNATLIQCANPVPEGGTLIAQETGIRFIGVCHGYKEWEHLARVMGMNPDLATVKIAGINHNVWLLEFLYQNQDAYPRLDEWIRETSEQWLTTFLPYAKNVDYQLSRTAFELYRIMGRIMPIGDTPRASTPDLSRHGFHNSPQAEEYYFGKEQGFESAAGERSSRDWRANNIDAFAQAAADSTANVQKLFPRDSGWQIVPIIASMATDQPSEQMVNVPNNGVIPGLKDRLVVEIPAIVNATGTHSDGVIQIPPLLLQEVLLPRQQQALDHVDAFRLRNKELLVQVLMRNHKVANAGGRKTAEQIINIWQLFDPEMANHYG